MTVQGSSRKGGIRSSSLSHLYCSTGPSNDLGFTSLFFENSQENFRSQKGPALMREPQKPFTLPPMLSPGITIF